MRCQCRHVAQETWKEDCHDQCKCNNFFSLFIHIPDRMQHSGYGLAAFPFRAHGNRASTPPDLKTSFGSFAIGLPYLPPGKHICSLHMATENLDYIGNRLFHTILLSLMSKQASSEKVMRFPMPPTSGVHGSASAEHSSQEAGSVLARGEKGW